MQSASFTCCSGDGGTVIVHGLITRIEQGNPESDELDSFRLSRGRRSRIDWPRTAFYARIDLTRILTKR